MASDPLEFTLFYLPLVKTFHFAFGDKVLKPLPDWGDLARTVRFLFVPEIRRQALELELQALDAFQHALLVLET